ncbi:O-methyltransferase-domain-containing protein [Microdochium trichocladiopsis]|uniref:O-methyltransferase-domain-containing protein n=1 Tax=Microdochium trichocladiopsis TaxID=1682393 RepID=A0A9P8XY56_9PEZI|nr:O-methyltransferase-domain-containing protein [Microdochium trichocladiopsis]KAH7024724.1 O-methyltransferase-domain-containing protein [Microdochium trichocladiopsis]
MGSITSPPQSMLSSLTATVFESATTLDTLLAQKQLPRPTFSARPGSRQNWADAQPHPDVLDARSRLIDAAQALVDLALGPADVLAAYVGDRVCEIDVLRTMDALGVAQAVPLPGGGVNNNGNSDKQPDSEEGEEGEDEDEDEGISIPDLAEKLGVRNVLSFEKQLRFAFLMGLFRLTPKSKKVAHTGLSAALLDESNSPYVSLRLGRIFSQGAHEVAGALRHGSGSSEEDPESIPCARADPRGRPGRPAFVQLRAEPDGMGMDRYSTGMIGLYNHHAGFSYLPFLHGFRRAETLRAGDTVVDVGGGNGHVEAEILPLVPAGVDFIIQDHASNQAGAEQMIAAVARRYKDNTEKSLPSSSSRLQFLAHDFFTPQPVPLPQGRVPKVYMLLRVLQDWDDADCARILRPLVPAMERHGTRLWIMNCVLPDEEGTMPRHRERMLRNLDLVVYTLSGGGERSASHMERMLRNADPRLTIDRSCRPPNCLFSFVEVSLRQ